MSLRLEPIGRIHTPFSAPEGMPIQPRHSGAAGWVEVFEPYRPGLQDVGGFEHVWLLFGFHRSGPWHPIVVPFLDTQPRGLFATRAPARPSGIGMSAVKLERVLPLDGRLDVSGVDILDGSPLYDIKPYVPAFDAIPKSRSGWMAERDSAPVSDDRFTRE